MTSKKICACGRNSFNNIKCRSCRAAAIGPRVCEVAGCEWKCGVYKRCKACRYPTAVRSCSKCTRTEMHYKGQSCCYLCHMFCRLSHRRQREVTTLTHEQFWDVVDKTPVCEDTGHSFVKGELDPKKRRSVDRIDNSRGYHLDNVRIVTWAANNARKAKPIDAWRTEVKTRKLL